MSRILEALDLFGGAAGEIERDEADDAEGAIDQAPPDGDAADFAEDEGVGNDEEARDDAEVDDPEIADGIAECADERNGDGEMAEGEPVGAVEHEGIAGVGVEDASVNSLNPFADGGMAVAPLMMRPRMTTVSQKRMRRRRVRRLRVVGWVIWIRVSAGKTLHVISCNLHARLNLIRRCNGTHSSLHV